MQDYILPNPVSLWKDEETNIGLLSDEKFLQILNRHLHDLPQKEIDFFVNPRRFHLLQELISDILDSSVNSILNVGSGPFAFENYITQSRNKKIDAFDIDSNLDGVFADLKETGQFGHVSYQTASAEEFESDKTYDLVLINDLFYHKEVDFNAVIDKYLAMVAPGGYVYFDILDIRARKIWSALGKDERFARYDLEMVTDKLVQSNFEMLGVVPSMGIRGKLDGAIRRLMYYGLGIANNYIFYAKKSS